jgi:hypothetical protein
MRQHLYSETLPVLASCWLQTLCFSGHNRAWWGELNRSIKELLRDGRFDALSRDVLLSIQSWIERNVIAADKTLARPVQLQPPFRSLTSERLVTYVSRMLNEWLPNEVAQLLTNDDELGIPQDGGIPPLAVAKALDRLLLRERLSPETLEMLLAPGLISPKFAYPADVEIMRDVVLAQLGRISAPPPLVMPAVLLGVVPPALTHDYEEAVRSARLVQSPGGEELHIPITAAHALEILSTDLVRIGSVLVTMDGRSWHSSTLHRGDQNFIAYTAGQRLRIDFSADHARLTIPWPESPARWFGAIPVRGPFQIFGREWRTISWEIQRDATLLHCAFLRVLPISETPQTSACSSLRLRPAYVDMAWSEVERALSDSLLRNRVDPLEQMRRTELIPLGRSLYGLAQSVGSSWLSQGRQIETQLRAVRYHLTATEAVYGRPPWRILPAAVQANLAKMRLNSASSELLMNAFSELPKAFSSRFGTRHAQPTGHPSRAA